MATPTRKPHVSTIATAPAPATSTRPVASTSKNTAPSQPFLFDRSNYMWMLGGLVLIIIGFFLLSGGKSADPRQFNDAEIYSFRRITLAPLLMLIGFGIEAYAIMKRPKFLTEKSESAAE